MIRKLVEVLESISEVLERIAVSLRIKDLRKALIHILTKW